MTNLLPESIAAMDLIRRGEIEKYNAMIDALDFTDVREIIHTLIEARETESIVATLAVHGKHINEIYHTVFIIRALETGDLHLIEELYRCYEEAAAKHPIDLEEHAMPDIIEWIRADKYSLLTWNGNIPSLNGKEILYGVRSPNIVLCYPVLESEVAIKVIDLYPEESIHALPEIFRYGLDIANHALTKLPEIVQQFIRGEVILNIPIEEDLLSMYIEARIAYAFLTNNVAVLEPIISECGQCHVTTFGYAKDAILSIIPANVEIYDDTKYVTAFRANNVDFIKAHLFDAIIELMYHDIYPLSADIFEYLWKTSCDKEFLSKYATLTDLSEQIRSSLLRSLLHYEQLDLLERFYELNGPMVL